MTMPDDNALPGSRGWAMFAPTIRKSWMPAHGSRVPDWLTCIKPDGAATLAGGVSSAAQLIQA